MNLATSVAAMRNYRILSAAKHAASVSPSLAAAIGAVATVEAGVYDAFAREVKVLLPASGRMDFLSAVHVTEQVGYYKRSISGVALNEDRVVLRYFTHNGAVDYMDCDSISFFSLVELLAEVKRLAAGPKATAE